MPTIATKLKRTAPFSFRRRDGDEVKKSIIFPVRFLVPFGGVALTKRCGADGVNGKALARRARALAFQTGNPLGTLKKYQNINQDYRFAYLAAGLRVWQGGWAIVLS